MKSTKIQDDYASPLKTVVIMQVNLGFSNAILLDSSETCFIQYDSNVVLKHTGVLQ